MRCLQVREIGDDAQSLYRDISEGISFAMPCSTRPLVDETMLQLQRRLLLQLLVM